MDVKYIPSDWEKMKDGIGDLIGLGRWGKGMIDDLKDITDNLEDAESDIASLDSDGVISFHHTSQKDKFQHLYEDFEVLHRFTGKVGDIVDRTIDQPFYEDIDAFVEAMRDLTPSNYTTKNRIGATEVKVAYAGYGQQQTFEVPKAEVSIDDIFNGDNYYAEQMKLEFEAWKELNPDQDFSQKEYQLAAVNTHAFEYESIRNQQESKEFWGQIAALVVIVGVSLVCPPAGIALGAVYGTFELSSAVSGKDWISGRELGTGERVFRGLLSPLDIIPGVSSITKFSGTVRLAHLGDMGKFSIKTGIKSSIKDGAAHIGNMVETAGKMSATRLKSASSAIKNGGTAIKNKVVEDAKDIGRLVGTGINKMTNIIPSRKLGFAADGMGDVGHAHIPVDEARVVGNEKGDVVSRIDSGSVGNKNFNEVSTGFETRGYRPQPGERLITKEEWKALHRKQRMEANYPKPIVHEKNYDAIKSNPKYYTPEGEINWPPDRGVLGKPEVITVNPGTIIDRFGYEGGTFVSPYGIPYEMRALAPETYLKPYNVYVVAKPVEVQAGKIAPWFDEPGLGMQYELNDSVKNLIEQGVLRRVIKYE
ncbi:TNT domain-containing protein [Heyndrickxia sporothermodurans]|uniref:TNT domain-containing protein n=1 Tax=Heyndrickxia sporothermodurans TaxID=46224 RepID=A0A150KMZ7_9BACI|nr:glycohydrolase toxin TNT-related protein [Heyndrickxia sporothermodurans]KYC98002.1 hypothetical protein B4102_3513 [Heyndrickxia sporothermodurans]MBL5769153.1 TNT domain-containing protein [Heyndrickxia sporothermodurans]MBL5772941.1 TNT domain-containing protein [Heyndrickxia sporothermodurans]MBL5776391.1 TNT domain-containing protein [Heyndrickxia sporothermodurans]MBL5787030.1 TNT domain-containing protein [Heyndrickxia sporothermodurans]